MRLRYNDLFGKLSTGITSGATTFSSAVLASLPDIVAPDVLVLCLNPSIDLTKGSNFEIIWVTAHTAGASSATIARGKEGSTGIAFTTDTVWENAATVADYGAITPQTVTANHTFVVPEYYQMLIGMDIVLDGYLDLEGYLIEV